MSTSEKHPATIRQGGPGSSHQDAKAPLEITKPPAEGRGRSHSGVSGGGGEKDVHHSHRPTRKGGQED